MDILIGFLISFCIVTRKVGSLKSVVKQDMDSARAYTRDGSMTVTVASHQFVNRIVTEVGAFSGIRPPLPHPHRPLPGEVPLIPVLPDVLHRGGSGSF